MNMTPGTSLQPLSFLKVDEQRRGEVIWPELDVEPCNPLGMELLSKDATPPGGVTGVRAAPTPSATMVLTWNAATDAESGVDSYNIYRNGAKVATVCGTRYTDPTVEKNKPRAYQVAALNRSGLEGARSAAITVTVPTLRNRDTPTPIPTPPGPAANLSITPP